jgi:peptidoglycan hydrolase-like protein with peptidoglycan-binding domain
MSSNSALFVLAVGASLVLSACGDTTEDRAVSGAGIGAAGGAVVGAVTGLGPVGGALIGAAVGGAAGALTDSSQVNLGKPVWRSGSPSGATAAAPPPPPPPAGQPQIASVAPAATSYDLTTVRNIQAGLQRLGYDPGPADGNFGPRTDTAIRHYQQDNNLPVDGAPTVSLWEQIRGRING